MFIADISSPWKRPANDDSLLQHPEKSGDVQVDIARRPAVEHVCLCMRIRSLGLAEALMRADSRS